MPVPCFMLFFRFRNIYTENIVKIGGNLFPRTYNIGKLPEDRRPPGGGGPRGPHPMGARPGVGPCPARVWGPWLAPGSHPSPIYSPRRTLKRNIIIHGKFRRGRHRQSQIEGVLTFSRHPAGGEIITGGFFIIMPASEVMRE